MSLELWLRLVIFPASIRSFYRLCCSHSLGKGQNPIKQRIHHGDTKWHELGAGLAQMGQEDGSIGNGETLLGRHRWGRANLYVLQRCSVVHAQRYIASARSTAIPYGGTSC